MKLWTPCGQTWAVSSAVVLLSDELRHLVALRQFRAWGLLIGSRCPRWSSRWPRPFLQPIVGHFLGNRTTYRCSRRSCPRLFQQDQWVQLLRSLAGPIAVVQHPLLLCVRLKMSQFAASGRSGLQDVDLVHRPDLISHLQILFDLSAWQPLSLYVPQFDAGLVSCQLDAPIASLDHHNLWDHQMQLLWRPSLGLILLLLNS